MRIFQHDAYIVVDFQEKTLSVWRPSANGPTDDLASVRAELSTFDGGEDTLLAQIETFLNSITTGAPPVVSGDDGRRALETALLITERMRTPQWKTRQ